MTTLEQFGEWQAAMLTKYPESVVQVIMRNISKGPDGKWSIFNHGVAVCVAEIDRLASENAALRARLVELNGDAK